jgi:hypothetical protein
MALEAQAVLGVEHLPPLEVEVDRAEQQAVLRSQMDVQI